MDDDNDFLAFLKWLIELVETVLVLFGVGVLNFGIFLLNVCVIRLRNNFALTFNEWLDLIDMLYFYFMFFEPDWEQAQLMLYKVVMLHPSVWIINFCLMFFLALIIYFLFKALVKTVCKTFGFDFLKVRRNMPLFLFALLLVLVFLRLLLGEGFGFLFLELGSLIAFLIVFFRASRNKPE